MTIFCAIIIDTKHRGLNKLTLPYLKKDMSGEYKFDNGVLGGNYAGIIPTTEGERVTRCKLFEVDLDGLKSVLPDVLIIDDVYNERKKIGKRGLNDKNEIKEDEWKDICYSLIKETLMYASDADVYVIHLHK